MASLDLIVAVALVATAAVVYLLCQMGVLPVKTVPYVVGALLGLLGIQIFREYRSNRLRGRLAELQKELDARQRELETLKQQYRISEQQYAEARSQLDAQRAAYQKEILLIRAQNAAERQRIDSLDPSALASEFDAAFAHP